MVQVAVNPMMGAGFFAMNTPSPLGMVMSSLIGHLVFGAVVGKMYTIGSAAKTQPVHA